MIKARNPQLAFHQGPPFIHPCCAAATKLIDRVWINKTNFGQFRFPVGQIDIPLYSLRQTLNMSCQYGGNDHLGQGGVHSLSALSGCRLYHMCFTKTKWLHYHNTSLSKLALNFRVADDTHKVYNTSLPSTQYFIM